MGRGGAEQRGDRANRLSSDEARGARWSWDEKAGKKQAGEGMIMREWPRPIGNIKPAGFTLVELVVVGIIVVMMAVGLPYFSSMIKGSRLDGATRQLASDVREARSRATLTGWQYKIFGYKYGGGGSNANQYRILGRSSSAVAWPSDTAQNFQSSTQMAGPWVNFTEEYPGVQLNAASGYASFYVSFNSMGITFENNNFNPLQITSDAGGSKSVTVTAAGGVKIQ